MRIKHTHEATRAIVQGVKKPKTRLFCFRHAIQTSSWCFRFGQGVVFYDSLVLAESPINVAPSVVLVRESSNTRAISRNLVECGTRRFGNGRSYAKYFVVQLTRLGVTCRASSDVDGRRAWSPVEHFSCQLLL